jgi:hypothetical protein
MNVVFVGFLLTTGGLLALAFWGMIAYLLGLRFGIMVTRSIRR